MGPEWLNLKTNNSGSFSLRNLMILDCKFQMVVDEVPLLLALHKEIVSKQIIDIHKRHFASNLKKKEYAPAYWPLSPTWKPS